MKRFAWAFLAVTLALAMSGTGRAEEAVLPFNPFEKASKDDPSFDAAVARVAIYRFKQDANADAAIDAIERAVAQG